MNTPAAVQRETAQDSRIFGTMGGRAVAVLLVAVLFCFYVVHERADARRKLETYTRETHAAAYKDKLAELKETATESDGEVVAYGAVMCVFLLLYEGTAAGIGWLLVRLTEAPRTTRHRVDGP